ncbi:MAG: helix-turn-helix transcriptional regulator [Verrucomicrobia bacterium]|nr:helix-turn-helix transcriptional regulator [Verrucomicrobiota bacterium]
MRASKTKSPPQPAAKSDPRLTKRERQVLEAILRGLSDKLVSAELGISQGGTRRHVDSLLRKFKVNSRLQLVVAFLSNVVISPR